MDSLKKWRNNPAGYREGGAPKRTCPSGAVTMAINSKSVRAKMEDRSRKDVSQEQPLKHRRNAVATRQAILDSARVAFTRSGYDGVGVREIAQNAGVTAMLVNRYFGSKEKLFEEVVEVTLSVPGILRKEITKANKNISTLSRELAIELVAKTSPGLSPLDGILLLIRSAANKQAAGILRESALRHLKPLVDILPGCKTAERAAMLIAVIAGFQLMRQIIGLSALTEAAPSDLSDQLKVLFECLLTEDAK
jgi:AcrR family transcriptional regulator